MSKYLVALLSCYLFTGCNKELVNPSTAQNNQGYFSDASDCRQSSARTEKINLPTPIAMSVVEVPTGYDAGKFTVCMEFRKRPVARADATEYLNASTACLHEAQSAEHPDDSFADCIKRSHLQLEYVPG
jgi:hypothetical protein